MFKDNKDIVGVQLGSFITKIPDSAFEGCSSLKYLISRSVTKIGNNAFSGCTSLDRFTLPIDITELGTNAFEGVPEIKAVASKAGVACAVASSGADKIILDISSIPKDESKNMELKVGETTYFELQGKDKEYAGLSLKSDAATTVVNGVIFSDNVKIPMELSSGNVTLDRVTVNGIGFALVLKSEQTNVIMNRTVSLISAGDNAVLCRNITLSSLGGGIIGKLAVSGNVLVCGSISGANYLTVTNGEIINITGQEFENYLSTHRVYFDANEGTVSPESKLVAYNAEMGELPIPSRDDYTFSGWYTKKDGGEKITSETIMTAVTDITIYAHWTHILYTVTFNANGGSVSPELRQVNAGDPIGTLPTPMRSGYDFLGWYTATVANGGGSKIEATTVITASLTIYARWGYWTPDSPGNIIDQKLQYRYRTITYNIPRGEPYLTYIPGYAEVQYTNYAVLYITTTAWSGNSSTPSPRIENDIEYTYSSQSGYYYYRFIMNVTDTVRVGHCRDIMTNGYNSTFEYFVVPDLINVSYNETFKHAATCTCASVGCIHYNGATVYDNSSGNINYNNYIDRMLDRNTLGTTRFSYYWHTDKALKYRYTETQTQYYYTGYGYWTEWVDTMPSGSIQMESRTIYYKTI